jgi:tryptophan synthase alpha chain
MTTLSEAFARARAEDRAALIAYLPAGFPDREAAGQLLEAMVAAGVDIVEVGLPYSDPLMDGPVIAEAAAAALGQGTTTDDVIALAERVADSGAAALVMSYWNPIERYGPERFAAALATAGGVGVITPDLTPEEADSWRTATDAHHLDRVFLVAPSSSPERIATVAEACSGFVYAASIMGVTGARDAVATSAADLVARVRAATDLPVAVGLGVSTGDQAAEIAQYADGVIVGSAFVKAIAAASDLPAAISAVVELTRELAAGVRRRSR